MEADPIMPKSVVDDDVAATKSGSSLESRTPQSSSLHLSSSNQNHVSSASLTDGVQETAVQSTHRPLNLLDLPVDVLKEIVKELTHTNDLAALALTHSALHRLAVPHIYSRFDIVWPDTHSTADPRTGVDALTYGLATLVMGEDVFHWGRQRAAYRCTNCGHVDHEEAGPSWMPKRRYGNDYAKYTRKFSLGNGPADWVSEYMINKESGKMLGTLVALAIARMPYLETFVWDMPTGVIRDVWLALASIADRNDGDDCRLERLWIRWHDNTENHIHVMTQTPLTGENAAMTAASAALLSHSIPAGIPPTMPPGVGATATSSANSTTLSQFPWQSRVEYPTFSILPPLKSLSVLDIDEPSYVKEMSVLIGRSKGRLHELRVGIARHAMDYAWVKTFEPSSVSLLGLLLAELNPSLGQSATYTRPKSRSHSSLSFEMVEYAAAEEKSALESPPATTQVGEFGNPGHPAEDRTRYYADPFRVPNKMLNLDVLEFERVTLAVSVLQRTINWTLLSTLTILHCPNHEQLWKYLRHTYTPKPSNSQKSNLQRSSNSLGYSIFNRDQRVSKPTKLEYRLNLKRLHTNMVSSSLIAFIKEALAPDSLEWLFLQDSRFFPSPVTIDAIFKAVRRHKGSLKKLMIDSSERMDNGQPAINEKWKKWMFPQDLLKFVMSGSMTNLRELGMALDYRDWHTFLQSLPKIRMLRSLYIPFLTCNNHCDTKELALQILDAVALRPEIELCYIGLRKKCYEILEGKPHEARESYDSSGMDQEMSAAGESEEEESDEESTDDDEDGDNGTPPPVDFVDSESDISSNQTGSSEDGSISSLKNEPKLRLREILFYDDKVSVFKIRHGRL